MCIIYSYGKSAVRFRFVSESDNFFIKWTDPLPLVSSVLPGDAACEHWRFPGDRPGPATFPFHASRVHPSRSSPNETAPSFSIHVSTFPVFQSMFISPLSFDLQTDLYYPQRGDPYASVAGASRSAPVALATPLLPSLPLRLSCPR